MVLPYIDSYFSTEEPSGGREPGTRYADAPQLLVPNPAGIAFTRLLGRFAGLTGTARTCATRRRRCFP